ncbi:MAG: hypothetical protein RL141_1093 [Candidatus Parcubacteria bacterium]|jgi:hypothetical protein
MPSNDLQATGMIEGGSRTCPTVINTPGAVSLAPRRDPPSRIQPKPAPKKPKGKWKVPKYHQKPPRDRQKKLRRKTYARFIEVVRKQDLPQRRLLTDRLIKDIKLVYGGKQSRSAKEFSKLIRAILETLRLRLRDETDRPVKRKDLKDPLFVQKRRKWVKSLRETIAVFETFLADVQDIHSENDE